MWTPFFGHHVTIDLNFEILNASLHKLHRLIGFCNQSRDSASANVWCERALILHLNTICPFPPSCSHFGLQVSYLSPAELRWSPFLSDAPTQSPQTDGQGDRTRLFSAQIELLTLLPQNVRKG